MAIILLFNMKKKINTGVSVKILIIYFSSFVDEAYCFHEFLSYELPPKNGTGS